MTKSIFIIVPAYNEAVVLDKVLQELTALPYTVIVVDDGSSDNTSDIAKKNKVLLAKHLINLGQGAALQTGMNIAREKGATAVVHFDADDQHDPGEIPLLLSVLENENADIVFGSRFIETANEIPVGRKWLLRCARYVNWLFTGLLLTDAHNGFRVLNERALNKIELTENRMAHATEILQQTKHLGLKWLEAPVTVRYSDYSKHKGQGNWSAINIFFDLLVKKFQR